MNFDDTPQEATFRTEARKWIKKAEEASARDNFPALREAIEQLWVLQPPDQLEAAREQAMRSGLKRE